VALRYVALGVDRAEASMPALRYAAPAAVCGLLVALAFGFFGVIGGDPPFTHLPGQGEDVVKLGRLELITAVGFDVGLFVLVAGALTTMMHQLARLVEGGRGLTSSSRRPRRRSSGPGRTCSCTAISYASC